MDNDRFPSALRDRVVRAARIASQAGLFVANQGNFSVRDPGSGTVAITPHDLAYDLMSADDLVVVSASGERVGGDHDPSYDLEVHLRVYARRPDVGAVIHTEPPYVNAFGAVGQAIEPVTTTGLKSANGAVPVMPFRTIRDAAFADEMLEVMGDHHGVVWANHGLLVVGPSIEHALDRSLGIEFNAKVYAISRLIGEPASLAYLDARMVRA
jgi:L-ribulose-5-phosphate 4-epimerase